jgi:phage terminase large subunit
MAPVPTVNVTFAPKFAPLFQPFRYKVYYGGRGAAKSWAIARALLLRAVEKKQLILCARELQNSIKDSVHKLLCDQIEAMGLQAEFTIQKDTIIGNRHGSSFIFAGIKSNITRIKSFEAVDVCWVEEAEAVSDHSWSVLIPTIRKPKSELWISFNPELETNATYVRFVKSRQPNSVVVKVSWRDNPWFEQTELMAEMLHDKATDPDRYLWVWEGHCKRVLDGAVYKNEIRAVLAEDRLTFVPYERSHPVDIVFDLGRSDKTAVWFKQTIGFEHRYFDFYQKNFEDLDHYIAMIKNKSIAVGTIWLPHDAKAKTIGAKLSVEEQMRKAFPGRVRILKKLSLQDGIFAARRIFPKCFFDVNNCEEGFTALGNYKFDIIAGTSTFSERPKHDENSHAADAFRYSALAAGQVGARPEMESDLAEDAPKKKSPMHIPKTLSTWMGL